MEDAQAAGITAGINNGEAQNPQILNHRPPLSFYGGAGGSVRWKLVARKIAIWSRFTMSLGQ